MTSAEPEGIRTTAVALLPIGNEFDQDSHVVLRKRCCGVKFLRCLRNVDAWLLLH